MIAIILALALAAVVLPPCLFIAFMLTPADEIRRWFRSTLKWGFFWALAIACLLTAVQP